MNMTLSYIITGSFLSFALVTRSSSCSPGDTLPFDFSVNQGPPPVTFTVEGYVTFPDGTPFDSAFVATFPITNSYNFNRDLHLNHYTDAAGHYKLDGVVQGENVFRANGYTKLIGWRGFQLAGIYGNQRVDVVVLPWGMNPVQSENRYRLSLFRYPLENLHSDNFTYPETLQVQYSVSYENRPDLDSVIGWTAYKIPLGVSWSDVTIAYLEGCGTPKTGVSAETMREWIAKKPPQSVSFLLYVPCQFFLSCTNGIAFVSTGTTYFGATFMYEPVKVKGFAFM